MKLEILQEAMIKEMKNGNKLEKNVISDLIAAIKKTAIDKKMKDNITEELVNEVLLKEQKMAQEMIETCPANRIDLLNGYKANLEIINKYAPKLLTGEKEIEDFIKELKIDLVPTNRGLIMKELKGKVDMKIANKVLGELL